MSRLLDRRPECANHVSERGRTFGVPELSRAERGEYLACWGHSGAEVAVTAAGTGFRAVLDTIVGDIEPRRVPPFEATEALVWTKIVEPRGSVTGAATHRALAWYQLWYQALRPIRPDASQFGDAGTRGDATRRIWHPRSLAGGRAVAGSNPVSPIRKSRLGKLAPITREIVHARLPRPSVPRVVPDALWNAQ